MRNCNKILFVKLCLWTIVWVLFCHSKCCAQAPTEDLTGLFPVVFNLATRARIQANATCGEMSSEVYCKLVEHIPLFTVETRQCDICDARSNNPNRRHPIRNAVDGSQRWWQSPTLTNGDGYNHVTITLDLGQIYQIAYVIVKAANSPRPGNWILERSLDGQTYTPWQYFALTDEECWKTYGIRATIGLPTFLRDDEVICTSRYSSLNPLENGEIFVSLVNGRPGVFQPSKLLLDFTSARYVRLRFQKIRTLNADLMTFETFDPLDLDPTVTRRYFYSVKDISIGGQCICYGHAQFCRRHDFSPDKLQCQCMHNTGGDNCEKCLPKFNQMPWQVGGIQNIGCKECNCHNKADECVYNATVDGKKLSLNMEGQYEGGGVCLNCRDFTTGINCERCMDGYYRRPGVTPEMDRPCSRCRCRETMTSTDKCVLDDSRINEGLNAGDCICKEGFAGSSCNRCAFGYSGYPNCRKCLCNPAGSMDPESCTGACNCKQNVAGSRCDYCKDGYFNLDKDNPMGCVKCFCFGVSNQCDSVEWGLTQVIDLNDWVLSTLQPGGFTLLPRLFDEWLEAKTYLLKIDQVNPRSYSQEDIHYWVAPMAYLGNKLSSYGGYLSFTIRYILDDRVPAQYYLSASNLVLEGSGISLTTNKEYLREIVENAIRVPLYETSWFHLDDNRPATREDLMKVLYRLDRILIRATYHTAQDTVYLKDVRLDSATPLVMDGSSLPNVEKCQCPEGYAGLSCESCAPGWTRVNNQLYQGVCRKCQCNNHASECDSYTGKCLNCQHSTTGDQCDVCLPGFYGDPRYGTPNDCKPCACPLISGSNFFAERCLATPTPENRDAYECLNCLEGYTGSRCGMCAPGFYGNPTEPGGSCRRCNCGGNIDMNKEGNCNNVTGICNLCSNNTEGEYCEKCVRGYYGSAANGGCRPCDCYERGSNNQECHPRNGQCSCKDRFTGRKCDRCLLGYGNIELGCERCSCDRFGSSSLSCDPVTGQCPCRPGVGGLLCDECQEGYYGTPQTRCQACECYGPGTENDVNCDSSSGICDCKENVEGRKCDRCKDGHFGLESGQGCTACNCDPVGSFSSRCDESSGECQCKPGVGGRRCDECLDTFYGFSNQGCSRCKPCNKPGHICDPITGDCVCPPNTEGPNCEKCTTDGWGYDPNGGCKVNVIGKDCDECRPNTFSLDKFNPKGCTECYCFLRGKSCKQALYVWTTVELPKHVAAFVDDEEKGSLLEREFGYLYIDSAFIHIPEDIRDRPVYWRLQPLESSDMTLSYGGNLSFVHYFEGTVNYPLVDHPIVVMVGNGFRIEYGPTTLEPMNPLYVDVPLHENFWSIPGRAGPIDRRLMMVILQNVEAIFVRAGQDGRISDAELSSITYQKAVPQGPNVTSTVIARGVEICECPQRYSGESCQNPGEGYYRVVPDVKDIDFTTPETVIGYVRMCRCFGHSDECDPETGACQNCQHNTTGESCDMCKDGFFGVATKGTPADCQPCTCPLAVPSNSFSPRCVLGRNGVICTACEDGYTGQQCESCSPGYFGDPLTLNDTCKPCNCNRGGSQSNLCNQTTGECSCIRGVTGRTCNECSDVNFVVENGQCVSCYTGCTGILLDELANLTVPSKLVNVSGAVYPWDKLYDFEKQVKDLRDKLKAAEDAGVAGLEDYKNTAKKYDDIANTLLEEAEETLAQTEKLREGAGIIRDNATALEEDVEEALDEIKTLIDEMNDLIEKLLYNESSIDMDKVLDKASDILAAIENRNFSEADNATREENKLAELLSEKTLDMDAKNIDTSGTKAKIDDLLSRLKDILNETQVADEMAKKALDKIRELKVLLARLKILKDEINKMNDDTRDMILDEARKILEEAENNFAKYEGMSPMVDFALSELKDKIDDLRKAIDDQIELTKKAIDHALNLTKQAEALEDLFSKTRNLSEKAVQAAKAYKSIVDAVNEAEESANKAKKAAEESTTLAAVSNLTDEVKKLIDKSQNQLRQARILQDNTNDLKRSMDAIESDLQKSSADHNKVKDLYDELKRKLASAVPRFLKPNLDRINTTTQTVNGKTEEALDLVRKFNDTSKEKLETLKMDISDFNYDISSDIKQAEEGQQKQKELIDYENKVKSKVNNALRKISDITLDLDKLKEKIRNARTIVNNMKLSLEADGQCHRSYRSPLTSSSTNEIRFSVRLNSTASDMLLVLLQQSPQEFLAAEIRNKNVRFSWNSGKGQGSVSHPQTIEPEKWYQVVAKRVGAVGQLKVWSLEEGTEKNTQMEIAATGAGCSLMNLNQNATILFGGSSDLYPIPLGVTRNNLVGYLGNVMLDANPIGIYNFKTTEEGHCGAYDEVPSVVTSGGQVYRFTGYGLASFLFVRYDSEKTQVEFQFKTFYEDSMLFFVGNENVGDFLSIQLKDGKIYVAFSMGGLSSTSGMTNNTYNNNQWTRVMFKRKKLTGVLTVFGQETLKMVAPGENIGLELQGSPMYFGGLPSNFKLDKFKKYIKEHPPYFYGCMQRMAFGSLSPEDDTSTLVNVEAGSGCRENGVHNVDFHGDGYLLLNTDQIEFADQMNDISLTFVTDKGDGILLVARDIPGENYYSISLVDGTIEARLQSKGTSPVIIKSTETFNDGNLHCVSLLKDGRTTEVTVDDNQIGTADSRDISFSNGKNLYLGGLPVDPGDITPINEKLDGCISDVIANGVLLSMADAQQYKRADVGRCRFTDSYPEALLTNPNDDPDSSPSSDSPASRFDPTCAKSGKAEIQVDAVSVGDTGSFFAKFPKVSEEDKHISFSIAFDFRTFYPNGLFGYFLNPNTGFYFGIQLIDGKLQVKYINKGKPVEINFSKELNDGRWHSVLVEKKERKVSASHDLESVQTRNIRKRMSDQMEYFFGAPPESNTFVDSNVKLVPYSIRGCLRGLELNGQDIDVAEAQVIRNSGSCYRKVEEGAFFRGDAWAMIDDDFDITPNFSISMEFRTNRKEAILASVSSQRGDSGFALEMYKGKMEFTLVLNARIHRVVSNSGRFSSYCDKEWHRVEVQMNVNTISLKLDKDKPVTMDLYRRIRPTGTGSALFIGGYKTGFHQGASVTMKPFQGCLRNVHLNGRKLNWYDSFMSSINVRKTACPVT